MDMRNKNLPLIIIVMLAALMIALVIWFYDQRIKNVEEKQRQNVSNQSTK
jgi:hypothetical protein